MEAAREASVEDLLSLEALAAAAADELRDQRGGAVYLQREHRGPAPSATLGAVLDDVDQLLVAGTIDETVVGYGVVRLEGLHDGTKLAVVDDLFVDPGARGVGVGEAIMNLLLEWATTRRAIGIDSVALPGMRDTKNFFETFGLVARAIVVHRPLPVADGGGSTPEATS